LAQRAIETKLKRRLAKVEGVLLEVLSIVPGWAAPKKLPKTPSLINFSSIDISSAAMLATNWRPFKVLEWAYSLSY